MQLHTIRISSTGDTVSYSAVLDCCSELQSAELGRSPEPELGELQSHQAESRPL